MSPQKSGATGVKDLKKFDRELGERGQRCFPVFFVTDRCRAFRTAGLRAPTIVHTHAAPVKPV